MAAPFSAGGAFLKNFGHVSNVRSGVHACAPSMGVLPHRAVGICPATRCAKRPLNSLCAYLWPVCLRGVYNPGRPPVSEGPRAGE